ncbi:unnamed protein product [Periconia digitata]|uniref:lytic cellulose monooxygenase (C4-dehydrogenating) n=1 Tax=Periconia digitata TaxID=1303443 RepID=A0A9W4UGC0_9PLEO|nr:unnamed protein product [Periconia digitata]
MASLSALSILFGLTKTVAAHGWIDTWTIASQNYTGFNPTNAPWDAVQNTISWPAWNTDLGPVYGDRVNHPDIICSINSTNSKLFADPITAGSSITLHWTKWPDSHRGPILAYIAACGNGDCATVDKESLEWIKIAEEGQVSLGPGGGTPGIWPDDELRKKNGYWNVKIPASIPAGEYVLRHELIALHSAYAIGGAQFYPQCVNIRVEGGGDAELVGVKGTELYTPDHPGVLYNIYNDEASPVYQIPGPKLCELLL